MSINILKLCRLKFVLKQYLSSPSDISSYIDDLIDQINDIMRIRLDSIDDSLVRMALFLHFVDWLPWSDVKLLTGDSDIRKKCRQYLRKTKKL